MKTGSRKISDIKPYEFNNRNHSDEQINLIAKSIKEFGFTQPLVIDENNILLVGHGRLLAAKHLQLKEVPVLQITGLSETKKRAYRILDNKLQNDSTWAFNNLELELDALEDEGFNLPEWGLDELKSLFEKSITEPTEDLSNSLESQFKIEISCLSEGHQKELYEKFQEEGLECRLLTL